MGPEVLSGPLSLKQLKDLLNVQPGVVLVGGQAVAFWADYFDTLGSGFESGLTKDLDFFGNGKQAEAHAIELKAAFPALVRYEIATLDTPPPSAAVILIDNYAGSKEPLVIDYVTALAGYGGGGQSEARMLRHAVDVDIDGVPVKVMHPFDCLKSRVHNLILIPSKRTENGIEQCRTAIRTAKAMLEDACLQGWENERRIALPMAEAIIRLAAHNDSMEVRLNYDIDLLSAIPAESLCPQFREKRWAQARAYVNQRFERRLSRHKASGVGNSRLSVGPCPGDLTHSAISPDT